MTRSGNRPPTVPRVALRVGEAVSKATLLEVAWHLAALANDAGSCDDADSTLLRLLAEIELAAPGREAAAAKKATHAVPDLPTMRRHRQWGRS